MNKVYRSVWNAALGAWVATSELGRSRSAAGTAVLASCLGLGATAHAADLHWRGPAITFGNEWVSTSNWTEGSVPGTADRAIIANTTTRLNLGGLSVGAIWVQSASSLTTFGQVTNPAPLTLHGVGGVGVQSDVNRIINFHRFTTLAGDISLVATNTAGGGFLFSGAVGPVVGNIDTRSHTLTFDPVNAANVMTVASNFTLIGSGNVVKAGQGRLSIDGSGHSYTGSTWVQAGTLALVGVGTLAQSSQMRVDGTLDVSATTTALGGTVRQLAGSGNVVLGSRDLTVTGGGTNFNGSISGSGQVVLATSGHTVLGGASTYTGGTVLKNGGRLDLASNGALGSGALAMDDGTTLGFATNGLVVANDIALTGTQDPIVDTAAFDATLAGVISGAGALGKEGSGTLVLGGANHYTGATSVNAGTLRAGATNAFSPASAHRVAAGAALDLAGFEQTLSSLSNAGTVSLAGSTPGNTLTVTGAYVGNGGTLRMGTALGDSSSASDRLVLSGPAASATGSTRIQVTNLGGLGALTTGNGIEVVTATGGATTTAQSTKDAFSLANGHLDAGAYEYRLYAADASGAGENWYLRSTALAVPGPAEEPGSTPGPVPLYRAEVPMYAVVPEQFRELDLAMLGNLHQRVGDERVASSGSAWGNRQGWGRILSVDRDIAQQGTVSPTSSGRLTGFQAGTDLWANPNWRTGLYAGQLEGDMDVNGFARGVVNYAAGRNDLRSQYFGAYATWSQPSGLYVDNVLQGGRHRYTAYPSQGQASSGKGDSIVASIEVGQGFAIAPRWTIEPQLQLAYQRLSLDDTSITGASIQQDTDNGWIARAGVRIKGQLDAGPGALQPYARVNLYKRSSGTDITRFIGPAGSTDIASRTGGTSSELALGATWQLGQSTSLYGELGKLWDLGGDARTSSSVSGSVGVKLLW